MEVQHDVDLCPNKISDKRRDPVRNTGKRRGFARAVYKRPVEVDAIRINTVACARSECLNIQGWYKDDAPGHVCQVDQTEQLFERYRTFVLVTVCRADGDHDLPSRRFSPYPHRKRN